MTCQTCCGFLCLLHADKFLISIYFGFIVEHSNVSATTAESAAISVID